MKNKRETDKVIEFQNTNNTVIIVFKKCFIFGVCLIWKFSFLIYILFLGAVTMGNKKKKIKDSHVFYVIFILLKYILK